MIGSSTSTFYINREALAVTRGLLGAPGGTSPAFAANSHESSEAQKSPSAFTQLGLFAC